MSIHRRRIDRDTAERLLRRDLAAALAGQDPLADLLAAAAAPARADELAGERAAMTAFRMAHRVPTTQPRSRSMIKTAIGKILTAKAAAVLAATAIGGVAVAASTGNLPTQRDADAAAQSSQRAEPSLPTQASHATGRPSTAGTSGDHSAAPSPSLVGLCVAFSAAAGDNPGKAMENPAFTALFTAAGAKDKAAAYCTKLLASTPNQGTAGSSTSRPSGVPTTHPTGAPTSHASGAPSTHPTSSPTSPPSGP